MKKCFLGRPIAMALLLLGVTVFTAGLLLWYSGRGPRPEGLGTVSADDLLQIPYSELQSDDLYITYGRKSYDGGMRLLIPSIGVDTFLGDSTVAQALQKMPGLYEFSQMPDEEGGNVSIAGHRDIYDKAFYSLDRLQAGDSIYLLDRDTLYVYAFHSSKIVRPDDWSVIARQGYTSITLTTCDPIGTALNRLVVTGEQAGVYPLQGLQPLTDRPIV